MRHAYLSKLSSISSISMTTDKCCWLSLDPSRKRLDYYPKQIAAKIEKHTGVAMLLQTRSASLKRLL